FPFGEAVDDPGGRRHVLVERSAGSVALGVAGEVADRFDGLGSLPLGFREPGFQVSPAGDAEVLEDVIESVVGDVVLVERLHGEHARLVKRGAAVDRYALPSRGGVT